MPCLRMEEVPKIRRWGQPPLGWRRS